MCNLPYLSQTAKLGRWREKFLNSEKLKWRGFLSGRMEIVEMAEGFEMAGFENVEMAGLFGLLERLKAQTRGE